MIASFSDVTGLLYQQVWSALDVVKVPWVGASLDLGSSAAEAPAKKEAAAPRKEAAAAPVLQPIYDIRWYHCYSVGW